MTFFCVTACKRSEIPIYKAIGLTPVSDVTLDHGIDSHRELIYENINNDPQFYHDIVKRVEACSTIKDWNCRKESGRDMAGESLAKNGFSDDDVSESITFRSSGSQFVCTISNGGHFVLILIYTT
jgi:hypothetical protein